MKFVPKVNTEGIKRFFVENVEKIAMLVGAICVVAAIFFAVRQETLKEDRQPGSLRRNTEVARKRVTDAGHAKLPVHEYIDEAVTGSEHRELASYAFPSTWNSPVKEERVKRGEPTLLSIERPRATTGYGAFAIKKKDAPKRQAAGVLVAPPPPRPKRVPVDPTDPNSELVEIAAPVAFSPPAVLHGHALGGDAVPVGFRWVCITGMIPVTKQEEYFVEKYKKAIKVPGFDANKDKPKFLWYKLVREEMGRDGAVTQTEISEAQTLAAWRESTKWETVIQEIVPSEYVLPTYNPKVGPLTGALGPLLLRSWDNRVSHPDIFAASANSSTPDAERPNAAPADALGGMDEMPMETPEARPTGPKVITHKLFRCFDYTVEPEKKYRYRVSLMFGNPNYIDPADPKMKGNVKYLEKPELASGSYVFSPPSEWTDWVAMPSDHRLLVAGVKPGAAGREPFVTVKAVAWDHADGVEVTKDFDMIRGDVAEWIAVKDKIQYLDPAERQIKPLVSFDFYPRLMLMDLRGGGINGNNGPLEVLLSDMRGNVTIQSEERDRAEVRTYTEMLTPADGGMRAEQPEGGGRRGRRGGGDPYNQ